MKFLIVTHVPHGNATQLFAYAPYVREMNIWMTYADEVTVLAPIGVMEKTPIHLDYKHNNIIVKSVPEINFQGLKNIITSLLSIPRIVWVMYKAMKDTDHIHLRCPGNIGLVGCFVQILFPDKQKTAKYAGNWDPKAKQPWSYKLQRFILQNTFLTKNMQVLVYGAWKNSSKNIRSFFTATYKESDKYPIAPRPLETGLNFLYVGTLSAGKRPMYAIALVEKLHKQGCNVRLELYGLGAEMRNIEEYIALNNLSDFILLKGNQTEEVVRKAYQSSHFLILPSKSEGWPKVVAESMFWGCLPIATAVSCVPFMLDYENRGILLELEIDRDVTKIIEIINNAEEYESKVEKAVEWSRKYTLDLFSNEIKAILNS